jgi:hypothetical protein
VLPLGVTGLTLQVHDSTEYQHHCRPAIQCARIAIENLQPSQ